MDNTLERGRQAFEQRSWADAYAALSVVARETTLEPEDLEHLATAAYLIGKDADSENYLARAHQAFLDRDRVDRAARCAFWLGMILVIRGERARGAGWIARARRLLDAGERDCVERGFLLVPLALQALGAGDAERADATCSQALEIGERFEDPNLTTLGRLGRGQALVRMGEMADGVALLDEAMVAVEADEVSPIVAGIVYCAVLEICQEIYALRRAKEWTDSMTRWCESQPDLVPYRGQCLVRRSEIMQLHGEWPDALDEAEQACARLSEPPGEPAAGAAYYQHGELLRLRGDFAEAEDAYRQASRWGRKPQPGLALLRLAQGQLDAAEAAIRRVEEEAGDRLARSRVLPAFIDIMLAVGDVSEARTAASELLDIAGVLEAPYCHAVAARADGAVLLAEGEVHGALDRLRHAWTVWEKLDAPYESARVRVLTGLACRELGDDDTAEMEFDAARWTFEQLGAKPDLLQLEALVERRGSSHTHGLTSRQLEVLQRIADGKTNKAIAQELFISERTVERHVSNIFARLEVSSRAAATAYAYEHELV